MRVVGWLLLILVLTIWGLSEAPSVGGRSTEPVASTWRRTRLGWEEITAWQPIEPTVPSLHPLVVAALQGLLSAMALMVFPTNRMAELSPSSPHPQSLIPSETA